MDELYLWSKGFFFFYLNNLNGKIRIYLYILEKRYKKNLDVELTQDDILLK